MPTDPTTPRDIVEAAKALDEIYRRLKKASPTGEASLRPHFTPAFPGPHGIDELEALSEALQRAGHLNEWRPIEGAPTDRQVWLAYRHKGQWVYRLGRLEVRGDLRRWLSVPGDWHFEPTHWQLPKPPGDSTT